MTDQIQELNTKGSLVHKENIELYKKFNCIHQENTEIKKKVHASSKILPNRDEACTSYDFFVIPFYPDTRIWNHIISFLSHFSGVWTRS
jgi:hypothetical protein